jgi:hypothetical protein
MIQNISDKRTRPYRWLRVDVIAEPTWHDNSCPDSDQAPQDAREPGYAAKKNISLADAINWVAAMPLPMTLYVYDGGTDTVAGDVPWPPLD